MSGPGHQFTAAIVGWARLRKAILDRDRFMCRICNRLDGEGAKLNVHHIEYDRTNNEPDQLVTLCTICHRAVHAEGYKPSLYEDWPVPWGVHTDEFA